MKLYKLRIFCLIQKGSDDWNIDAIVVNDVTEQGIETTSIHRVDTIAP